VVQETYVVGQGGPPLQLTLMDQYFRYLAFDVDIPGYDWRIFDFGADLPLLEPMHQILDPVRGDVSEFAAAGGKLLIYQGWGDVAQSPYRTIEYYQALRRRHGRHLADHARLFLAPGMYHCNGGTGPNTFDALTALERWVEAQEPPASIIAAHTFGPGTNRTRPLCPYPEHAVYLGQGSIDEAANFVCGCPAGSPGEEDGCDREHHHVRSHDHGSEWSRHP